MAHGRIIQVGREFIPADKTIGFGTFYDRDLSSLGIDYIGDKDECDAAELLLKLLGDTMKAHYAKRRCIVIDREKLKAKLEKHLNEYKAFVSKMTLSSSDVFRARTFLECCISCDIWVYDWNRFGYTTSLFEYLRDMADTGDTKIYYNYSIDCHY